MTTTHLPRSVLVTLATITLAAVLGTTLGAPAPASSGRHAPSKKAVTRGRRTITSPSKPATTATPNTKESNTTGSGTGEPALLTVTVDGGFSPTDVTFRTMPLYYLSADGKLVSQGPQIATYPLPALPSLVTRQISARGRTALLEAARAAGLLGPPVDYGRPNVADLQNTSIVIRADGQVYRQSAYALGFDDKSLTAEQRAAKQRLTDFVSAISDPAKLFGAGDVGDEGAFPAKAFRLQSRLLSTEELSTSVAPPSDAVWPLAPSLLTTAPCTPIAGADAATLVVALSPTTSVTQWRVGAKKYLIVVRPLLPGEPACP